MTDAPTSIAGAGALMQVHDAILAIEAEARQPAPEVGLREVAGMLEYLWGAETYHGTPVRDLFYDDDPLVADMERIIAALAATPTPEDHR